MKIFVPIFLLLLGTVFYSNCGRFGALESKSPTNVPNNNELLDERKCELLQLNPVEIIVGSPASYLLKTPSSLESSFEYSCNNSAWTSVPQEVLNTVQIIPDLPMGDYHCQARFQTPTTESQDCVGNLNFKVVSNLTIPNPVPRNSEDQSDTGNSTFPIGKFPTEYQALVGIGFSNFKDIYNPQKLRQENGKYFLNTIHGSDTGLSFQHRIFIPPGSYCFTVSLSTYGAAGDGQRDTRAAYRIAIPPNSTVEQITETNTPPNISWNFSDTLKFLASGIEGKFYSPSGSGGLMVSTCDPLNHPFNVPMDKGGWLYGHILASPWNKILNLQYLIGVEKLCYEKWYASAKWDSFNNPIEGQWHSCE